MKTERYNIVFETGDGIILDVSEKTNGLVIKASLRKENEVSSKDVKKENLEKENTGSTKNVVSSKVNTGILSNLPNVSAGEYAKVLSVYTDKDGKRAVVPPGFTVSGVPKENIIWGKNKGLVIYRIPEEKVSDINWLDPEELEELKETYDQFVWTPVSLLKPNGTLDGVSFNEKFGRRNYRNVEFSEDGYDEELVGDLALEKESVDKYGGYYSTRYDISIINGEPRSVKGEYPWTGISESTSERIAKTLVEGKTVNTHLMYGTEYDTREEWVKETKTKKLRKIAEDSTKWGNYLDTVGSPKKVVETGSREDWCVNNIYDFTGNVVEWTQERYAYLKRVIRGGSGQDLGCEWPADNRFCCQPDAWCEDLGFRATLYIK